MIVTEELHWYVQSGSRVRGPYSTTEVGRYLLLGRIKSTDRVSKDGELWEPVTQVPELIPEELLDLDTEQGFSHFLKSRSHHDERSGDVSVITQDRRGVAPQQSAEKIRDQWVSKIPQQRRNRYPNLLPISLLGVSLAALAVVIYLNSMAGNGL